MQAAALPRCPAPRRLLPSLRSAPRRDPGRLRQRGGLRCAPLRGAGGVRKRPRPPPQPGIPRFVSDTPGSATRVRDSAAAGGERPGSAVSSRHLPRPPSLPPSRCFAPVLAKGKEVAPRRAVPCRTLPGCAAPSAQPPPFLCPALPCPLSGAGSPRATTAPSNPGEAGGAALTDSLPEPPRVPAGSRQPFAPGPAAEESTACARTPFVNRSRLQPRTYEILSSDQKVKECEKGRSGVTYAPVTVS